MDNRVDPTASFDLPRPLEPWSGAEQESAATAASVSPSPAALASGQAQVQATVPEPPDAPVAHPESGGESGTQPPSTPATPSAGQSVEGGGWPTPPTPTTSPVQAAPFATPSSEASVGGTYGSVPAYPGSVAGTNSAAATGGATTATGGPAAAVGGATTATGGGPVYLTGQSASFLERQSPAYASAPSGLAGGGATQAHSPYDPWQPAGSAMPDYGQQTGTNYMPGPAAFPTPEQAASEAARHHDTKRRGPSWLGVTGIALACSLAASAGTFALMGGPHSSGQAGAGSVTTVAPLVDANGEAPNWQAVQRAVGNSVVSIELESADGGSSGSGVVIDQDGHIVTNHHVVAGAIDGIVTVTLADGRIYDGTVVGSDSATDLAVVKLNNPPADLSVASLGTSDNLQVGQAVAAIGNPLGYASTMTTGIISALDRPVWTEQDEATGDASSVLTVTNAIQIDASINPGNSGGPLFDAGGRVIGINSSIATIKESSTEEGGSIGLGFAIPVDVAKLIADQIISTGTVKHAFLGVSLVEGTVELDGAGYTGAKVVEVTAGSSAQNAGVKADDVIVSLNGKSVASVPALMAAVRAQPVGAQVKLSVVRGGEKVELDATLQARSESDK